MEIYLWLAIAFAIFTAIFVVFSIVDDPIYLTLVAICLIIGLVCWGNWDKLASWDCCGETIRSDYCMECGQARPEEKEWNCCSRTYDEDVKFCQDCGKVNPLTEETTSEKEAASDNNIIIEKDGTTAVYSEDEVEIIFKTKE